MLVNEIFKSIDGEGIRTGYPVVFIRLYGCNLRCSYCDSKYSYENRDYTEMSQFEIIAELKRSYPEIKRITLTGGEPLMDHKESIRLVDLLCDEGYEVNIETNGCFSIVPYQHKNTIITMDFKSPSSGERDRMDHRNLAKLRKKDVLKFVVGSMDDLDDMKTILTSNKIKAQIFVSPVFGNIHPKVIVEYVLACQLTEVRVQLQLHKFIWPPEMRGV